MNVVVKHHSLIVKKFLTTVKHRKHHFVAIAYTLQLF